MKKLVLVVALAFVGYLLFTLGDIKASSNFKAKLDSLDNVNDSLLAVNEEDSYEIAKLQVQDSILTYNAQHQKTKVIKIREVVEVEINKIDNFNEQELISYLNKRYPKDTATNPLPVAQPVLASASKDLAAYDGAKQELIVKDSVITLQDKRLILKDNTIGLYIDKEGRYKSIIGNQDLKINEWSKQYKNLYLENNKLKLNSKLTKIGAGVIIGGLIYMTIAK
jgi:hypothetical protein